MIQLFIILDRHVDFTLEYRSISEQERHGNSEYLRHADPQGERRGCDPFRDGHLCWRERPSTGDHRYIDFVPVGFCQGQGANGGSNSFVPNVTNQVTFGRAGVELTTH